MDLLHRVRSGLTRQASRARHHPSADPAAPSAASPTSASPATRSGPWPSSPPASTRARPTSRTSWRESELRSNPRHRTKPAARGVARAAERIAARELVVTEYQPRELGSNRRRDAHRARDAAVANLLRTAGMASPAWAHGLAAPIMGWVRIQRNLPAVRAGPRIRRAEHVRLRAQLESYSDRELMARRCVWSVPRSTMSLRKVRSGWSIRSRATVAFGRRPLGRIDRQLMCVRVRSARSWPEPGARGSTKPVSWSI